MPSCSTTRSPPAGTAAGSPGAFSVVPIANALPAKIVATQALPTAVAVTNDRAVVAERDDATKTFGAYLARMPQLMVDRYPLASPPIAVGVVAGAKRAFIAQQHPEGRLTFIDLDTRRRADAHGLRAVLARRRREQAMKKVRISSLVVLALAACGDRPDAYDAPISSVTRVRPRERRRGGRRRGTSRGAPRSRRRAGPRAQQRCRGQGDHSHRGVVGRQAPLRALDRRPDAQEGQ